LEAISRWHAFAYLCTSLGCTPNMGNKDSCDVNIELEGECSRHTSDIDVITYLQVGKVSIGLTPKECD